MARGEITGKKSMQAPIPQAAASAYARDVDSAVLHAHNISEGMYYKMKKQNRSLIPREMKVGTRTLITFEAAAKWRAEREAASAAPPEKARAKREQPAITKMAARPAPDSQSRARSMWHIRTVSSL